jgi:iron complex transport system ATP-binding protein
LLRAADLTFGYGETPVVRGVSLEVPANGFVGIIGPNGSGKTTLLRLLAGTRKPQRGSVQLDGVPLASLGRGEIARRMAVVPQETQLAFEYSVLEVVLMGRYPHLGAFEIEGPRDVELARAALAATGTLPLEPRPFSTLSGGEKQRVIIAAALAQISASERSHEGPRVRGPEGSDGPDGLGRSDLRTRGPSDFRQPAILLLDEPTAALDLKYQLETASLLRSLHAAHALSVVVSTHDLNFAAALCHTLVMLKDGVVLAAGRVDDVLTPERIRDLYDVDADVTRHPRTGHLTIVPVAGNAGSACGPREATE